MTYGELKKRVMELVFSYSVAGSEIPAAYNNQADYIAMIPGLVNNAQMDIATSVKRLPAKKAVNELIYTESGGKYFYEMPSDCWLPFTGGLYFEHGGKYERFFGYQFIAGKIEMPCPAPEGLYLEYWRYPRMVTANTADSIELDNTPDVHQCLVYYVAANLLVYDDAYRFTVFMNEYKERMSRLKVPVWVEPGPIEDVYRGCRYGRHPRHGPFF